MNGFAVNYAAGTASDLVAGEFSTVNVEGGMPISWLDFTWDGGLVPGKIYALHGRSILLPDQYTSGAGPYCVVEGSIGAPATQPTDGSLHSFPRHEGARPLQVAKRVIPALVPSEMPISSGASTEPCHLFSYHRIPRFRIAQYPPGASHEVETCIADRARILLRHLWRRRQAHPQRGS